ncbi:CPBP family intramembrane glutamic endopeptidase [Rhodanobacter sp. DHB23]|uniref:CPBP family intramembrane glutamic endopeptidase n=1 Tax=Rhodanobacter sp. DHB23 TaxID=2775923 RepID=UPI00177D0CB1|nr:CPBP family intramembrane glutamic endopeptidase [Rhodanobacter sp. DHB23]MBD8871954.1 CPBP family intramembrane metalloprotease [Rhodanobacter sp. DHB23]
MDAPRHSLPPSLPLRLPDIGNALGMIVLYFVLQVAIGMLAGLLLGVVVGMLHHDAAPGIVQAAMTGADVRSVLVTIVLLGDAAVTLWLVRRFWPPLWSQAQPPGFGFTVPAAAWCALAVAVGLTMPWIGGKLTELLAHGADVPQDVKQLGGEAGLGFRFVLTLVVASVGPLVEELLFRGVLLSALLRRMRAGWAALASGVLFALVHLPDLHWLWYALPNLALLGVALAWLRLRSGSLWPSVIAHGCNNLLAMAVLFASLHHPG